MEMDKREVALKKAILLAGGPLRVSPDFRPPFLPSRSTAGPGAGSVGIVLSFGGVRVKKAISTAGGDFQLVQSGDRFSILREGEVFIQDVEIKPTLYHAPEQAFFNLDNRCIYDCKFCTSNKLDQKLTKDLDPDKVVKLITEASSRPDLKSVALTSGVVGSPGETVRRLVYVISKVREALPTIPIGVEPYVSTFQDIEDLKAAGADEIKLNIETFDRDIFDKVCGGQDFDGIMRSIEHAVKVFGRGKVTSNIILGFGETDQNVLEGVEAMARLGCVPTLRPLRINDLNRKPLEDALGPLKLVSPERILRLCEAEKSILERYGLTTLTFHTMCHACTSCDIVPFRDL